MFKFKPFEEVLVRNGDNDRWHVDIFDYKFVNYNGIVYKCLSGTYPECIPFKGNEKYYLTTRNYEKPWIPEEGEVVVASDDKEDWEIGIFVKYEPECTYPYNIKKTLSGEYVVVHKYCEPLSKHFKFS